MQFAHVALVREYGVAPGGDMKPCHALGHSRVIGGGVAREIVEPFLALIVGDAEGKAPGRLFELILAGVEFRPERRDFGIDVNLNAPSMPVTWKASRVLIMGGSRGIGSVSVMAKGSVRVRVARAPGVRTAEGGSKPNWQLRRG